MIKELPDITERVEVFGVSTARDLINRTLQHQQFVTPYSAHEEPNIPSGFENLDQITKGFRRGALTVVATRPGNGKTAFLLSLISNLTLQLERRVALFTPERSAQKVMNRLIESTTRHSVSQIRGGMLKDADMELVNSQIQRIASAHLFFDEAQNLDARELMLRCYHLKEKYQPEIILVDAPYHYVSHIQDTSVQASEMQEMLGVLQHIATEMNVPVVCFLQLDRPAHPVNGSIVPVMEEMPPCMAAAGGQFIFIHRPEFYNALNKKVPKGTVELLVYASKDAKVPKSTYLRFIESIDTFVNP
ncbi:MAG TPA: DnaB-like helicase C-terminal domain-containing protein [Bacteroidales bacterium]|nr:DnaB-like helicase C-terminal domain-containing protein [Bacteroidales bacterium]HRZ49959.1 DnaB-like helicase C-terminal domain-containing protein [Bacteroidales bacterium]